MEIEKKYIHESCAGACIYDANSNILIVKNKWGNWTFPKGYFEPHDASAIDCARREVREETNIRFNLKHQYTTSYEEIRHRQSYKPTGTVLKQVILFSGTAINSKDLQIDKKETIEAKFVSKKEFVFLIETKEAIKALEAIEKLNYSLSWGINLTLDFITGPEFNLYTPTYSIAIRTHISSKKLNK